MQGLVHGANADVMPTLMLIALYSSRGKWVMHARGKGGKCKCKGCRWAMQEGQSTGCAICQASAVGVCGASAECKRLKVKM